ncbi:AEC family transporter [Pseudomonas stutzeri]|nr:AEC family transporter [Stutzerimonas stutzeri]
MLDILSITAPIFLLIGLGFLSVQRQLLDREQIRGIGSFVIRFALPALLIHSLATRPVEEILNAGYLLAYGLASLTAFAAGFALARWGRREGLAGAAMTGLGMSASNSGFIGYPVVVMVIGPLAALPMALCMLVESLLMVPLALSLAEAGRQRGGSPRQLALEIGRRLAGNPVLIGILVGLGLSLFELRLPPILLRPLEMMAQAAAPAALFVIGGTLHGIRPAGMLADAAPVALGKLLLHPLAVYLAFALAPGVAAELKVAALLFASAPMFTVYPLLAQQYGQEERCAAALVVTTVLSFFSMSLLLALLPLLSG